MHNPFVRLSVYAAVMLLAAFNCATYAHAGELVVRCLDRDGRPVRPGRAELLYYGWGFADACPLDINNDGIVLPLDEVRLRRLVGKDLARSDGFFLYIEAEGYAPVRSAPFGLPGCASPPGGDITVSFPGCRPETVEPGKTGMLDVLLRRPVPRSLALVDDDGKPAAGVEVISYMYWSSSNHCARLSGARVIGRTVSDHNGVVEVPDGDIEYAFEIAAGDMGLVLADPELPEYPERLVTMLKEEKTVVKLHRRKKVTLTVRVTKNGVPVPEETLYGCMADCPGGVCASCCGPLSTTDTYGVISIPGFYPEAYTSIYIQSADGSKLFEADPRKLKFDSPIGVDLAFCASPGGG